MNGFDSGSVSLFLCSVGRFVVDGWGACVPKCCPATSPGKLGSVDEGFRQGGPASRGFDVALVGLSVKVGGVERGVSWCDLVEL